MPSRAAHTFSSSSARNTARTASGSLLMSVLAVGVAADFAHAGTPSGTVCAWGFNQSGQTSVPSDLGLASLVAGGDEFSLALLANGTVRGWGLNGSGQLDIPFGLSGITAISAGSFHGMALQSNGVVVCWGNNSVGQSDVPVDLGFATAISAGSIHSMALDANGVVWCWGDNHTNQCNVPVGLGPAIGIAAGLDHSAAIKSNGDVQCWGANNLNQCDVPVTLHNVTKLASGAQHMLALTASGVVVAWGDDSHGEATVPTNLGTVTAVAAGMEHSMALLADGTVRCWGQTLFGACTPPAGLSNAINIGAGGRHSLAIVQTVAAPTVTLVSSTPTTCGLNNGAIDISVTHTDTVAWTGPNGFTSTSVDLTGLAAGNYSVTATGPGGTATLPVTVGATADIIAPVIASYTPADSSSARQNCTATVPNFTSSVVASDNCTASGSLVITQSPVVGTSVGLGATTVRITVTDASGNSAHVDATFTVTGSVATYFRDSDGDGFGATSPTSDSCAGAPTGYVASNTDCNDSNAAIHAPISYYIDADHDNYGSTATASLCETSAPAGYSADNTDCNDGNAAIHAPISYYIDADHDNYGSTAIASLCETSAPVGYSASNTDCNDGNSAVHPGATEVCNGIDDDCIGGVDNGLTFVNYYTDGDSDGYGAGSATSACAPIAGKVTSNTDCNDSNSAVHPGATEVCNGIDDDCVGGVDNGLTFVNYYTDADGDGYGSSSSGATNACAPIVGKVANNTDCNDANTSINPGATEVCDGVDNNCVGGIDEGVQLAFYPDSDGDGFGDAASPLFACSAPAGYVTDHTDCDDTRLLYADVDSDGHGAGAPVACGVRSNDDHCPTDPAKLTPGFCGCGHPDDANGDGNIDCAGTTLTMARITPPLVAGCPMIVRVSSTASQSVLSGLQLAVRFDTNHLRLDAVNPVEGGPFSMEIVEQIDNTAGTLRYAVGVADGEPGTDLASGLVDLVFTVLDTNPLCGASDLVQFAIVDGFDTEVGTMAGGGFAPLVVDLPRTNLDCIIPVLSGVPSSDVELATDAGSIYGAFVAAPTVTAIDNCDGPVAVSLLITYPDTSTSTVWPADSMFPIGTSTVRYTAVDSTGNLASESYTVDVGNFQLLDAHIAFQGALVGSSTRQIRIKTGALTQVVPVSLTGAIGTISGVHVPVALGYSCMSAKDAVHALTDIDSPIVVAKRYDASFTLLQGDSNDDDLIDIFDFSLFAVDRGFGKAADARSNFNADTLVNNCDFTFICINFFKVGQSCSGAYDGAQPVARVSVKELRRTGRGNLAVADINHDGWVDTTDMQLLLEGGRADGSIDQPVKIERPRTW